MPANAKILLTIEHNGEEREVEVITNKMDPRRCNYGCSCVAIADDLQQWELCISKLVITRGSCMIRLNVGQWAYLYDLPPCGVPVRSLCFVGYQALAN